MRIRNRKSRVVLGNRPFSGGLGASLYIGTNGPDSISYRRGKVVGSAPWYPTSTSIIDPGAATVPKCQAVAQVTSPTTAINYTLPEALLGSDVWCQVRTFRDDLENESVYLPRQITIDDAGADATQILGTAEITEVVKLDGGGCRVSWSWIKSKSGAQPTQFVLSKVSGAGTITPVTVAVGANLRLYSATIIGLTDGVSYVFKLDAQKAAITTTLIASIPIVGDTSGPPTVSNLSINPA